VSRLGGVTGKTKELQSGGFVEKENFSAHNSSLPPARNMASF